MAKVRHDRDELFRLTFYHSCNEKHISAFCNNLHREDGPAVIWDTGIVMYYLDNTHYSEQEFYKEVARRNIGKWWLGLDK